MTVIGCSGSFPGPESPASSYLVQAEDADGRIWSVLLDLGNGALGVLQRHLPLGSVDAVLLSHLHPDHCLDMCGLYVTQKYRPGGPGTPVPVWGPVGTGERLAQAYGGGEGSDLFAAFDFHDWVAGSPVTVGPFTITVAEVWHPVLAYAVRVEADGVVLVYSGDTDLCEGLVSLASGATLLLADSAFVEGRDATRGIHMTGRRCAQAAVQAGVQRLMLTHLPAWNDPQVCRAQAAQVWPGEVELAQPEVTYSL
ncbi:MBL fold metallo-hydrolase [Arsenicicoccus dermatophilus]|uniref:MBL fold metallo-hydrolase n=1 Tax=Arsenicicoccus dermatophilus TaxID=1076331 RepID=UPI0024098CA2|nr:MBL fold metallo-hydrolase [Arsenicicoccus dermatophilus]